MDAKQEQLDAWLAEHPADEAQTETPNNQRTELVLWKKKRKKEKLTWAKFKTYTPLYHAASGLIYFFY